MEVLTLWRLVKERERFVRLAAVGKVRIRAMLQMANPALMDALSDEEFSEAGRLIFCTFSLPASVVELGRKRFLQSLRRHGARSREETVNAIFIACEKSSALYDDMRRRNMLPFDYPLLAEEAAGELAMIEFAEGCAASPEPAIDERYRQLDPAQILRQVPGLGPTIAPDLETLSSPISRFRNAKAYTSCCGLLCRSLSCRMASRTNRDRDCSCVCSLSLRPVEASRRGEARRHGGHRGCPIQSTIFHRRNPESQGGASLRG